MLYVRIANPKHYHKCCAVRHNTKFNKYNPVDDEQTTQVPRTRLVITQKETTIYFFIYRKIPTVSMPSQTRTGKINTTNLILINVQLYQKLRRFIHKYSSRHCAQACTMTSQYPVKIHIVASFSIFHNKITVPASNGKLTCLVSKLKQTHSILLQVRDKTRTNRR